MTNENPNDTDRMQELGGSGYEIVDGQPDIKGWDVKDTAGHELGQVNELIFDMHSRKVLYIIVDVDGNDLGLYSKKVPVPIGLAALDEKEDEVILAELIGQKLGALPAYEKGMITPATESQIRTAFTGFAAASAIETAFYESHPEGFYDHEHFNEKNFYGSRATSGPQSLPVIEEDIEITKRQLQTGGVRLTSSIVEHEVQENITLKSEHVHVDRTAVDRLATPGELDTFQEGSIELIEYAEVPVVSKTAVVVEEILLSKDVVERDEVIKDTLRSTEVDVEKLDSQAQTKSARDPDERNI